MNQNTPIKKSIQIEIPLISSTATTFNFPDIPYLRNKKITAIQMSQNTRSLNTDLRNITQFGPIVPSANAIFFTFVDTKGTNFIQNLPVVELQPNCKLELNTPAQQITASNTNGIFEIISREIVFPKSSVYLPRTIGVFGPFCLLLNIFYKD